MSYANVITKPTGDDPNNCIVTTITRNNSPPISDHECQNSEDEQNHKKIGDQGLTWLPKHALASPTFFDYMEVVIRHIHKQGCEYHRRKIYFVPKVYLTPLFLG